MPGPITSGRSASPGAIGSATASSIRRRSIRTFSPSSTRSPATAPDDSLRQAAIGAASCTLLRRPGWRSSASGSSGWRAADDLSAGDFSTACSRVDARRRAHRRAVVPLIRASVARPGSSRRRVLGCSRSPAKTRSCSRCRSFSGCCGTIARPLPAIRRRAKTGLGGGRHFSGAARSCCCRSARATTSSVVSFSSRHPSSVRTSTAIIPAREVLHALVS